MQEFLVSLGWQVDKEGQRKFTEALASARKVAEGVAAALAGVGAAVVATADAYSRLAYEARNAQSSASGIGSLAYAMKQVGGSADGVRASLQNISNFLRFSGPGAENMFHSLGIATRDARGQIRDTSDILTDFFAKAREMPQSTAKAYADRLGIDTNTLIAGEADPGMLNRARQQWRDIYRHLGIDPDKTAAESQKLMQQINYLMAAIQAVGEKITLSLIHAFGGKDLDSFTNYLLSHSEDIAHGIETMVNWVKQTYDTVVQVAKYINDLVTSTVGWKTALEGVFALFVASKVAPVITALGQILSLVTKLGAARKLLGLGGVVAEVAEAGGVGAAGTTVGGAVVAGAGLGALAYEWGDLFHTLWKNAHPDIPKGMQDRESLVMRLLGGLGYGRTEAAAITGNAERESSLDPAARNGNHFGLFQWNRERATNILRNTGIDVTSPYTGLRDQIKAFDWEYREKGYGGVHAALTNMRSALGASDFFARRFEAPGNLSGEQAVRRDITGRIMGTRYGDTNNTANTNVSVHVSGAEKITGDTIAGKVGAAVERANAKLWNSAPRQQGLIGYS